MTTRSTRSQRKAEEEKDKPKMAADADSDEDDDKKPAGRAPRGAAATKAADKKKAAAELAEKKNADDKKKKADEEKKDAAAAKKEAAEAAKKKAADEKKAANGKKAVDDAVKAADPSPTKKSDISKVTATPSASDAKKEETNIVKKIINGAAPVDDYVTRKDLEVHYTASKVYSAKLNQANVDHNNNKFYVIQVLKSASNQFFCFTRWGRVGVPGQNALKGPTSSESAIAEYEKKFREKTVGGDYRVLEMDFGEDAKAEDLEEIMKKDAVSCKLPKEVIGLISLIFDMKMINNQMKEIGYDVKKMPLGKLSKDNITKAYKILEQLYKEVEKAKNKNGQEIKNLSNDFYSYIPHDFGFKNMQLFILDTPQKVKEKIEMIESIQNIQIATKMLEDKKDGKDGEVGNQIQANYEKLKCGIQPVKDVKIRKTIEEFVQNTHAKSHNQYSLKVLEVFELEREGEDARYTKDIKNKMLLWHGSRLTNFVGIISQGLRIAPPEAPVTGYMFGKGVYFADMCSKSANYCFTNKQNNIGLMLLCEVALGEYSDKFYSDYYAANLPPGKHSTRGRGKTAPDESSYITLYDDVKVPYGEGKPQTFPNGQMSSLLYNEFIVYDINQIKMKYLLKLDFVYKY